MVDFIARVTTALGCAPVFGMDAASRWALGSGLHSMPLLVVILSAAFECWRDEDDAESRHLAWVDLYGSGLYIAGFGGGLGAARWMREKQRWDGNSVAASPTAMVYVVRAFLFLRLVLAMCVWGWCSHRLLSGMGASAWEGWLHCFASSVRL